MKDSIEFKNGTWTRPGYVKPGRVHKSVWLIGATYAQERMDKVIDKFAQLKQYFTTD